MSRVSIDVIRDCALQNDIRNFSSISDWLKSVYLATKKEVDGCSYIDFTEALGFGKNNLIALVVTKKRSLSKSKAQKLAHQLKFNETLTQVLLKLADFSRTKDPLVRGRKWEQLAESHEKRNPDLRENEVFQFLDHWESVVILEALTLFPQGARPGDLSSVLLSPPSKTTLLQTLNLLISLGLASQSEDLFHKTTKDLDLGSQVPGSGVVRFHHHMMSLAQNSLTQNSDSEREVSSVTLACSRQHFEKIRSLVEDFQKYLMWTTQESLKNQPADSVYQVNFQIFPLAHQPKKNRKKEAA